MMTLNIWLCYLNLFELLNYFLLSLQKSYGLATETESENVKMFSGLCNFLGHLCYCILSIEISLL